MKKTYRVSRRMVVPITEYQNVHYEHSLEIEFTEKDMEQYTIIDSEVFKELGKEIDAAQRKEILDNTGIKTLVIDRIQQKKTARFPLSSKKD